MTRAPVPMLASPAGTLPALDGWTIEPKWDGIRVLADVSTKGVALWSRNGIDKAHQFPEVRAALANLARKTGSLQLDGELVATDRAGNPLRFQALQARNSDSAATTAFVVFDVLSAGKRSLTGDPWTLRRAVLDEIVPKTGIIRRGETARCGSSAAKKLLAAATRDGWEGLIVKRMSSAYVAGKRSPDWRKVKLEHEQEFVIGGFTPPTEGADRQNFAALLVGYYDDAGALIYAGKVGTGYTRVTLDTLGVAMKKLVRATSPFADAPRSREERFWIKPVLVAQIRYNEMTAAGLLRQPAFLGLRDDKKATEVRLESETSHSAIIDLLRCGKSR